MRHTALAVMGVLVLAVLALFLVGQARILPAECTQWSARATPMGATSLQEQARGRPLLQMRLEPGWEPFGGTVRAEGERGKVSEPVLRPYLFERRCLAR